MPRRARLEDNNSNNETYHSVLEDLGTLVRINFPGVGENFQEQGNNAVIPNTSAEATGVVIVSQTSIARPAGIFGSDLAQVVNSTRKEHLVKSRVESQSNFR